VRRREREFAAVSSTTAVTPTFYEVKEQSDEIIRESERMLHPPCLAAAYFEEMDRNPFRRGTDATAGLQQTADAGFLPARLLAAPFETFFTEAHAAFREFVMEQDFPCVGARAAFNSGSFALVTHDKLGSDTATVALAQDLFDFTQSPMTRVTEYATLIAVFRQPLIGDEHEFERLLWHQLQQLHKLDALHFRWDDSVRSDPADPQFSFSFAGQALYVIGLHPNSSRLARQFRWPALVFNPHEQFERLRADGKWKRMQQTIRERDVELQGSVNPMLSDFGETTEARQYSGRAVEEDWHAPFVPADEANTGKCPFGH
jgi:FPC/CPF motif-containing protein YcgG